MNKRLIAGILIAVVASAVTASVVVVVAQQDGPPRPAAQYDGTKVPLLTAVAPTGLTKVPPGTPVAGLALPMDYDRFHIRFPASGVSEYVYAPGPAPPPGVNKLGVDIRESGSLDELRDHELFVEPPYIPAGWELTWAQAKTVIWDDGSRTDLVFGLQYDRPGYQQIRIKRLLLAPDAQVELLAPPATAQEALTLGEIRGVPVVFQHQAHLQVHFVTDNVVTRIECVAIDLDELINIADALIAQMQQTSP